MTKKDYKNLIILEVLAIAIMLFLTHGKYVFGSQTDWAQQHYFFADSFRKLFYQGINRIRPLRFIVQPEKFLQITITLQTLLLFRE